MIGGARGVLHDLCVRCIHGACSDAGLNSQCEVVVRFLATPTLTEPRVDINASGHPGLPHLRLDFTVADETADTWTSPTQNSAGAPAATKSRKGQGR